MLEQLIFKDLLQQVAVVTKKWIYKSSYCLNCKKTKQNPNETEQNKPPPVPKV